MAGSIFQQGVYGCSFAFVDTAGAASQIFDASSGFVWSTLVTRFGTGVSVAISNGSATKNLGVNLPELIEGIAFRCDALPVSGWAILREWADSGTVQVSLQVSASGQLQFFRGTGTGSPLGSATPQATVVAGIFLFLQARITFSVTVGAVELFIDFATTAAISAIGLNTSASTNAYANQALFVSSGFPGGTPATYFQDWYILDLTESAPFNTYLGNGRYQADGPTSDSATLGLNTWSLTTPQGTDYGNFANIPPNSSDYNSSAVVGARASCRFPNLGASTTHVTFFNTWVSAELNGAGVNTLVIVYRNSGTDQVGPVITPANGTYAFFNTISTIDPATGLPWTDEQIGATLPMEIGPEVVS